MRLALSGGGTTELEVCDKCSIVWFDFKEYQVSNAKLLNFGTPPTSTLQEEKSSAPLKNAEAEPPVFSIEGINLDNSFFALLGLPQEENDSPVKSKLTALPIVLVTCFVLSFIHFKNFWSLGFDVSDPWKSFGLSWITSIWVHADLIHLLTNTYFLWLFGDNVEESLGTSRFLELFVLGGICGNLSALIFSHHPQIYIGASGAVMALSVYYILKFPRARLSYFFPLFLAWGPKIRLPAYTVIGVFLVLDWLGVKDEMRGISDVGHLAHLGGAFLGFVYWLLTD
ncbi:MAG: rhomboid family intramembrane serine protease [Deltaproteobacteria bacterium]